MFDELTKQAIRHTLHCLAGCATGEVAGMAIGTALSWHDVPTIILAIALAFFFGYMFTFYSVRRTGMKLREAIRTAVATDTVSITSMEIIDNLIIIVVPGALAATLSDGLFWWSLTVALLVAFLVTVPVNRWFIVRSDVHKRMRH
jgi:Zn-dependent protease